MAAKQVPELTDKNVVVLETRSVPEGIAAKLAFDPATNLDDNVASMNEAIANIKTGMVTYSVRNFTFEDKEYPENKIIGLCGGKIQAVGDDSFEVLTRLIDSVIDDDSDIISIYFGGNVTADRKEEIEEALEEKYEDCDILVYEGGQPLYDFIFSVE